MTLVGDGGKACYRLKPATAKGGKWTSVAESHALGTSHLPCELLHAARVFIRMPAMSSLIATQSVAWLPQIRHSRTAHPPRAPECRLLNTRNMGDRRCRVKRAGAGKALGKTRQQTLFFKCLASLSPAACNNLPWRTAAEDGDEGAAIIHLLSHQYRRVDNTRSSV